MANQILLYGNINVYSAADFVTALEQNKNSDITVRINSGGGEPESGWAMIARFSEHKKNKLVKAEGKVYSMAAYFLCYADEVECLDVTQFVFHRAAYAEWIEKSEMMNDEMWASLKRVNDFLRKALEAKVDAAKFVAVTGHTLDEMFAVPTRLDVSITAEQAKELGLVTRVNKITPELKALINSDVESYYQKAATHNVDLRIAAETPAPISKNQNYNTMTLQELKASNPALYAEIFQLGATAGATTERDRIEACLVFVDIDKKAVLAAIESGKPFSQKQMAEFALKQNSPSALAELQKEAGKTPETTEVAAPVTAEQKEVAEMSAELDKKLGLKKA